LNKKKRFVRSHDIIITEELKSNSIFKNFWQKISNQNEIIIKDCLDERNTILQVFFFLNLLNFCCDFIFKTKKQNKGC
jgi:hypothetical protein